MSDRVSTWVPLSQGVEARGQSSVVAYAKTCSQARERESHHQQLFLSLPSIFSTPAPSLTALEVSSRVPEAIQYMMSIRKQDGRTYKLMLQSTPTTAARTRFPQHHRTNIPRTPNKVLRTSRKAWSVQQSGATKYGNPPTSKDESTAD